MELHLYYCFLQCGRIWKLRVRGMAVGTRGCLPRLNRVLRAVSVTIYWTLIRSELMELHPYYSVLQMQPHLETACPRHGHGNPRVPAAAQ